MIYFNLYDNYTRDSVNTTAFSYTKLTSFTVPTTKLIPTTTLSTTVTTTTVLKKIGLVGDSCIKVIGDCGKYMECKKHESVMLNISTCSCIDGYITNSSRNCSINFIDLNLILNFISSKYFKMVYIILCATTIQIVILI